MATCLFPLKLPVATVPCGRCRICLRNRAMDWTTRLILEMQNYYTHTVFLTLTYARAPRGGVSKRDIQLYLKRVRKKCKVRYFAVGEYGELFGRPHYHVIMFVESGSLDHVVNSWKLGTVDVGKVTAQSCAYVAGYCLKGSRWPVTKTKPFSLMSRRPGLGYNHLTPVMRKYYTSSLETRIYDGTQFKRMPRYFRKKLFNEADSKFIAERNIKAYMKSQDDLIRKLTKLGYRDPLAEIRSRKLAYAMRISKTKTKLM